MVPAGLEDVERAGDVALGVVVRMRERVTHAGLRREVDDAIGRRGEGAIDRVDVTQVGADEFEPVARRAALRAGVP